MQIWCKQMLLFLIFQLSLFGNGTSYLIGLVMVIVGIFLFSFFSFWIKSNSCLCWKIVGGILVAGGLFASFDGSSCFVGGR